MPNLRTVEVRPDNSADVSRFSDFVRDGPKGHILQTLAWGDLKARTGWVPLRFLVEESGSGAVRGAISVLLRRVPLPGFRLEVAYAPRGPVVDYEDEEALAEMAGAVGAALRRRGAVVLKIDPDVPASRSDVVRRLERLGFRRLERGLGFEGVQPRFVFRLPLHRTVEDIMAAFQSKTRYNIRLAERKGVTVRVGKSLSDLDTFYRILEETARRDGFLIRAKSYYRDMWELLVKEGLARLFLADYEGQTLAGAIAFILGPMCWYVYGASSSTHREVMPNYLLQWTMIRWAKEQGCTLYDFRGVSGHLDPSDPLYGLYRFKKGFGAEFTEFIGEFDLVLRPAWYLVYAHGEPAYRRLRARLRAGGRGPGSAAGAGDG
ncbi:MAG: peptidoglycan bridge formation glycyltransferase FemA/FemB family protein [Bacillota bacterium]|nr:MAG: peptidoglycan bridge formation glycyltransferase FemA/FemB family protein [Bacillota bacterium]